MGMNPDTNRFEMLYQPTTKLDRFIKKYTTGDILRPNGEPVPKHWSVFKVGEEVVIKDYTFKVAYLNETTLILEPVGVPIIGETDGRRK